MPRTYLIFGDIEGKLDVLRVECTKCDRRGVYYVHRLIKKIRTQGKHDEIERATQRGLPEARPPSLLERCDLICPDLPGLMNSKTSGAEMKKVSEASYI